MALLNLLLLPILAALGLFRPDAGGGGEGGDTGAAAPAPTTGAAPAAGGTTPPATPSTTQQPATGDGDEDGDGRGSKAAVLADLAKERDKRQELAAEVERLRAIEDQHKTEGQRALDTAVKTARDEEAGYWSNGARAAAWRAELLKAGITDAAAIAVPPEVMKLKVDRESFAVEGIEDAAKRFRTAHPSLFAATAPGGSADQGPRGSATPPPATFEEAVTRRMQNAGTS